MKAVEFEQMRSGFGPAFEFVDVDYIESILTARVFLGAP